MQMKMKGAGEGERRPLIAALNGCVNAIRATLDKQANEEKIRSVQRMVVQRGLVGGSLAAGLLAFPDESLLASLSNGHYRHRLEAELVRVCRRGPRSFSFFLFDGVGGGQVVLMYASRSGFRPGPGSGTGTGTGTGWGWGRTGESLGF